MASHRAIHRPGHAPRRSALAWRGRTAAVLYLVSLAAACGFPETGTPVSVPKAEAVPAPSDAAPAPDAVPAPAPAAAGTMASGIPLDLDYVDRNSGEYRRFTAFVDSAASAAANA